jgi:hypothetical protein
MLGFVRDILDAAGEALVAGVVSIGAGPPFVEGIGLESSAGAGLQEDRWATGDVDHDRGTKDGSKYKCFLAQPDFS